jgi:predicted ArsR family transcriptional regulator
MTNQPTLFDQARVPQYPFAPAPGKTDTSRETAEAIAGRAETLRAKALALLKREALTADEVATRLRESPLAIRPRVTELSKADLIVDTGDRRPNASGRNAIVWKAK